jgi:hypothetical protein
MSAGIWGTFHGDALSASLRTTSPNHDAKRRLHLHAVYVLIHASAALLLNIICRSISIRRIYGVQRGY